jgi:hypothetical protein
VQCWILPAKSLVETGRVDVLSSLTTEFAHSGKSQEFFVISPTVLSTNFVQEKKHENNYLLVIAERIFELH